MKKNKKTIKLILLIITIIAVIFILLMSLVGIINKKIESNLVFKIEKGTYSSFKNIIYYSEDLYDSYSEETLEIIKKDFSTIEEYLKEEKNGTNILIDFKYVTDERRYYHGVQLMNGYKVKGTSVGFESKDSLSVDVSSFSIVDLNDNYRFLLENEMKKIVTNHLKSHLDVYYDSILNEMIVTCELEKERGNVYWKIYFNANKKIYPYLKIDQNGFVEVIELSEPIF